VAESKNVVHARAGFPVQPHFAIDEHPRLDVLVVPGGVHERELRNRRVID
jgi:hypothetical protein